MSKRTFLIIWSFLTAIIVIVCIIDVTHRKKEIIFPRMDSYSQAFFRDVMNGTRHTTPNPDGIVNWRYDKTEKMWVAEILVNEQSDYEKECIFWHYSYGKINRLDKESRICPKEVTFEGCPPSPVKHMILVPDNIDGYFVSYYPGQDRIWR